MTIQIEKMESGGRVYTHGDMKNKLAIYLSEVPVADIDVGGLPDSEKYTVALYVLQVEYLKENQDAIFEAFEKGGVAKNRLILLTPFEKCEFRGMERFSDYIHGIFPLGGSMDLLGQLVENALFSLEQGQECIRLENKLAGIYNDMRSLTKVGKALLTERNFEDLLELILTETRKMVGADGGSIYVVDPPEKKGKPPTKLRFKKSALNLDADEFLLEIDKYSIAGYVALTGEPLVIDDVYKLSGKEDYHFNPEFDKIHNYYTKSMMLIPMKNHREEVIGVIQLINKMAVGVVRLTVEDMKAGGVIPFTDRCYEIAGALAGQAAIAVENYNLVNEIKNLFEGFVKASVTAIEQRDPTTSGHSFRVAEYTEALALAVSRASAGELAATKFNKDQIRELRYASLLHDFGKVGVREKVLVKGKKLYEHELEIIKWRFHYLRKSIENQILHRKVENFQKGDTPSPDLDRELEKELESLKKMEEAVLSANEPTVLEEGDFRILEQLTAKRIFLEPGHTENLLTQGEFLSLSIKKGTLDARERAEIESHVVHTFQFLIQIPWTKDLEKIPDIAHFHHEKLDGSGYPLGIVAEKIPIQSRMMTISDIFDALTAWDRPYKRAVMPEKALDILWDEVKHKRIDGRLLEIFIETGMHKKVEQLLSKSATQ